MARNRIAMLRKEFNMNQRELGLKLGVGQTTISAWETGKNEPDNEVMNTMAQMFGVSIGYLAGYENNEATRGLTQEQIRQRLEKRRENREAEKFENSLEEDYSLTEDEADFEEAELLEEWNKTDPTHLMYLETYLINKMCDELSSKDRKRLYDAARIVYETAKNR